MPSTTPFNPAHDATRFTCLAALCAIACSAAPDPSSPKYESINQELKSSEHTHGDERGHTHGCHQDPPPVDPVSFTPGTAAARSGRLAGAAVTVDPLMNELVYRETLAREFSYVTPENETKWGVLQPTDNPKVWDFGSADDIFAFAEQNNLLVKGHTLVWHTQTPSFINDDLKRGELNRLMSRHIERTMKHFKHDTYAWDVVNEAIADDGTGLRDSVFSRVLGGDFVERAFRLAHESDKRAKLYYNDYSISNEGPKLDAVYSLMQHLVQRRVPVQGVGMQAHLDARFAPSFDELVANFERFEALGLSVNISELDVRVSQVAGNRARKLAVQKQVYQRVAAACVAASNCEAITTWGFTDAHSWVDRFFGEDDPLLFDENYTKKPAYFGLIDGFLGVAMDAPGMEPNLVGNSSFEAGLDQWSPMGSASLSIETQLAHSGLRSVRASDRAATWQGVRYDLKTTVEDGRSYDMTVFARIDGAAADTAGMTAAVTCVGEPTRYLGLAQVTASDSNWTELSGTLDVPACDLQDIVVYVEGAAVGVDLIVDDMAVRQRPLPNLLSNGTFDTDTAGWFGFGPSQVSQTADAHSGAFAAIATGRTAAWNGIATNIQALVQPAGNYALSAFVKIAGATTDTVGITVAATCDGGTTQYLPVGSATATADGWVAISGGVQLPNCTLSEVLLYAEGPQPGVDILLDDVMMGPAPSNLGANVVGNGGFESGTTGWYGFGSVDVSATGARAHSGAASGLVAGRTDTWNGLATNIVDQVTAGTTYKVEGYAQVGSGSSNVNLSLKATCTETGDSYSTIASATATDTEWALLEGEITVPTCTLTDVTVYIEGAPAGVDVYLDDVSVREQL